MNKLILIIIALIIVSGGTFYGGIKYQENKSELSQTDFEGFRNLSPEERMQRMQEAGMGADMSGAVGDHAGTFRGGPGSMGGPGMISGEIIAQNEDSFTIKLNNDSTRIVFISENTQITKSVSGILDDLEQGEQIFVNGSENPDGSYTAQTILIEGDSP